MTSMVDSGLQKCKGFIWAKWVAQQKYNKADKALDAAAEMHFDLRDKAGI